MAQIIPAINATSEAEFRAHAQMASGLNSPWVQIDVTDGRVGMPRNFSSPESVRQYLPNVQLELHLMVEDPHAALAAWRIAQPARCIIHLESRANLPQVFAAVRGLGAERALGLGPGTALDLILPHIDAVDLVVLVAVPLGRSGHTFDQRTFERLRQVRAARPAVRVGVDGGVTTSLTPALARAGADILYAASAIFRSANPLQAYQELTRLAAS